MRADDIDYGHRHRSWGAALPVAVGIAMGQLQSEWQAEAGGPCGVQVSQDNFQILGGSMAKGITISKAFILTELKTCCGIAVLGHSSDDTLTVKTACLAAKLSGYTCVQYTQVPTIGYASVNTLKACGFKPQKTFTSVRTGSEITIWVKDLYEGDKEEKPTKAEITDPSTIYEYAYNAVPIPVQAATGRVRR